MDPFRLLLEEAGIFDHGIEPDEVIVTPPPSPKQMVFLDGYNEELYQFHDGWGAHVLDNNEPGCLHPFGIDYNDEVTMYWKKPHRYSRTDRFRFTLHQLMGCSGDIPPEVVYSVKQQLKKVKISRKKIWNQIRFILKVNGWRLYYNRIPQLISYCTGLRPILNNASPFILHEFQQMHYQFDNGLAVKWKRSYFLNLRFVALKLMEKHGIVYPYRVPFVRTLRKKKYLTSLFNEFVFNDNKSIFN